MLLYHINVGYPVLNEGSRYLAPIARRRLAAHAGDLRDQGVGYRLPGRRAKTFASRSGNTRWRRTPTDRCRSALVNDALGLGFMVETSEGELPCIYQWQNFQAGQYTIGIEPATNHMLGKPFARSAAN